MKVVTGVLIGGFLAVFWGAESHARQAPAEIVESFFWVLIGISVLLVAIGALLVFIKLAQYLSRLTERLRE